MPRIGVESPWYTAQEAAEYLRISDDTFTRWVRAGRISGYRANEGARVVRFRQTDLDGLLSPTEPAGE